MKKVAIILTVLILLVSLSTYVSATVDPNKFDGSGATADVNGIESIGQSAISVISTVASIASVLVLIVLGIKYMIGSAEEKAEYKKTLVPYFLGAILIFAASTIASLIYTFAGSI